MGKKKSPLTVTVHQDAEQPEAIDVIAQAVLDVSEAFKKMQNGRLKERALMILIQDISGLSQRDIKKVLDACRILGDAYVKPATLKKP